MNPHHFLIAASLLAAFPFCDFAAKAPSEPLVPVPVPEFADSLFLTDNDLLNAEYPEASVKTYSVTPPSNDFTHTIRLYYTPKDSSAPIYLVLTTHTLYDELKNEIKRYAEDVHAIYGYGICVLSTENGSAEQLKALIKSYESNLCGVFFIGDLGEAMFEIDNDYGKYGYKTWPCDLFFMDLNGTWTDADGNGAYDGHSGHVTPEIFFGRLSARGMSSMGSETDLIRHQLQKSHYYWWRSSCHPSSNILDYIDKDWSSTFNNSQISYVFSPSNVDVVKYGYSALFSPADYLNRITYSNYGFTHIAAHSSPTLHHLTNGYIYANNVKNINSSNYAYNLFCCSACNWLANNNCYLGGAYLFNGGNTIAVVGSTKIGSMLGDIHFNSQFPTQHIGNALLTWWSNYPFSSNNLNTVSWFYGMTLLGDPTINFRHLVSDFCESSLVLTSFPSDDSSNLLMYKAENDISVYQDFTIPQGVEVILDAPEVVIGNGFCCPSGSILEIRQEGCEL